LGGLLSLPLSKYMALSSSVPVQV